METNVKSTTRVRTDVSISMQSTSEATNTDSTTTPLGAFWRWYDDNFFEGVEYNPDVVQSLSLSNISPNDFLSAEDIQIDDSGFWSSSCDVSLLSNDASRDMDRNGHSGDESVCFSNASDDNHSDSVAFDDWFDTFAQDSFDQAACQQQKEMTRIVSTPSILLGVVSPSTSDVLKQSPPDVASPRYHCNPVSRKRKRDVPPVNAAELLIPKKSLSEMSLIEQSRDTAPNVRHIRADVQALPQNDVSAICYKTTVNAEQKPLMSYLTIIAMAILSTPQKRSLLNDIYEFVICNFPYYERSTTAWRNSVRHNLSVNECFVKNGRAPSGRGFYWAIHPACLDDFRRGDFNRRQARGRAQTNFRLLEVYRQRAQVACSTHAAAQQDYYIRMQSTPTRQIDVYESQQTPQYQGETGHREYTSGYCC